MKKKNHRVAVKNTISLGFVIGGMRHKRKREYREQVLEVKDIPSVMKTTLGLMATNLVEEGWKEKKIRKFLKKSGVRVGASTMRLWMKNVEVRGEAISSNKASGSFSAVCEEDKEILCGWLLYRNRMGKAVHARDMQKFLKDEFGVDVDHSTVCRYAHDLGRRKRRTWRRRSGRFAGPPASTP
jgi:transposase